MFVRLADRPDLDTIVAMGANNVAETMPGEDYDPAIVRETFAKYLRTANPTFWVVEDQRRVIGFLEAYMGTYDYRAGLYTVQKVLYVTPAKRGTRAAVLLIRELIRWSKMLGADRIVGGNDNSFRSERTAKFLSHFGFEQVGYAMNLTLTENDSGRKERQ